MMPSQKKCAVGGSYSMSNQSTPTAGGMAKRCTGLVAAVVEKARVKCAGGKGRRHVVVGCKKYWHSSNANQ